jgi:hypothetical protein
MPAFASEPPAMPDAQGTPSLPSSQAWRLTCPAPWMSAPAVDKAASYASSCSSVMSSICNSSQRNALSCRVAGRATRTTISPCRTTRQIPSRSRGCQSGAAAILRLTPWPAARSPTTGFGRLTLCANATRHTTDTSTTLACSADRDREALVMVGVPAGLHHYTPMNNHVPSQVVVALRRFPPATGDADRGLPKSFQPACITSVRRYCGAAWSRPVRPAGPGARAR